MRDYAWLIWHNMTIRFTWSNNPKAKIQRLLDKVVGLGMSTIHVLGNSIRPWTTFSQRVTNIRVIKAQQPEPIRTISCLLRAQRIVLSTPELGEQNGSSHQMHRKQSCSWPLLVVFGLFVPQLWPTNGDVARFGTRAALILGYQGPPDGWHSKNHVPSLTLT